MYIQTETVPDALSMESMMARGHRLMQMTCEEHVYRIIGDDDELRERAETVFKLLREFVLWLEQEPLVHRLSGLRQLSLHRDRNGSLYPHNRLQHSRMVAANAIVFALMRKASLVEVATCYFAAMLHDVGHSAWSHQMDEFLVHHGVPNHETRGQTRIAQDPRFVNIFKSTNVESGNVVQVMKEAGEFGMCQSLADTLAYVELDSHLVGKPIPEQFAFALITSVIGVRKRNDRFLYEMSDSTMVQELLNRRAKLHHDVYGGGLADFFVEGVKHLMNWLVKQRLMTLVDFVEMADAELDARLAFVMSGEDAPKWIASIYKILQGNKDEVDVSWMKNAFDSKFDFEQFCQERHSYRHNDFMAIRPFSAGSKSLSVFVNGRESHLRGSVPLVHPDKLKYRVYTYKR